MVFEMLVFSPLNHLTRLIARENFIILSPQESIKSHFNHIYCIIMYVYSIPKPENNCLITEVPQFDQLRNMCISIVVE